MSPSLCHGWSRRDILKAASLGLLGFSSSGWFPALADEIAADPKRRRHCILLWMAGGPTQTDTFDMKPGHANGGEFKEVETKVPGLKFSEHLPKLAAMADKLAIIRSLSTKEGDHGRGTYLMRTGQRPAGPIAYPGIGSSLSKALGREEDAVPQNVAISPYRAFNQAAFGPGFLGPRFAPLTVGATDTFQAPMPGAASTYAELRVDDLAPPAGVDGEQVKARLELWKVLQDRFVSTHKLASPLAHRTIYEKALKLMNSDAAKAFDLSQEPEKVRDAYGKGRFGQGCLMARRLIEQGVSFVEVTLGSFTDGTPGWDTHGQNFPTVKNLSAELDNGWGTLMHELEERGLLESTTILWMGEFGRTPKINQNASRDHWPQCYSVLLAGGGVKGGYVYGKSDAQAAFPDENPVRPEDLAATVYYMLGIDPGSEIRDRSDRPLVIGGKPVLDVLA